MHQSKTIITVALTLCLLCLPGWGEPDHSYSFDDWKNEGDCQKYLDRFKEYYADMRRYIIEGTVVEMRGAPEIHSYLSNNIEALRNEMKYGICINWVYSRDNYIDILKLNQEVKSLRKEIEELKRQR